MRDILSDLGDMLSHPDPVRRAQIQMKKPLPKRFYAEASVGEAEGGYTIELDGRTLKTPARDTLLLPTRALADLVAGEWQAQLVEINPNAMPVTRLVNTALDAVARDIGVVANDIVAFAGTDMLCYRADGPEALVERQARMWNPILDWARDSLGARFVLAEGVIHQAQPQSAIDAFAGRLARFSSALEIASLHVMTTMTGSALLALAVADGVVSVDEAWTLAHLDEDWTIEHWGEDEEAAHRRKLRRVEFDAAAAVFFSARAQG